MAANSRNGQSANSGQGPIATATTEIVTQMARSAAGELVKGQGSINDVARKVVGEAVETLDKRGPELAKQAGIMTWRYALLGWVTWNVGKRVVKRKAKAAVGTAKTAAVKKGGTEHGAGRNGGHDDD
jgi:hypothetical protein